MQSNIYKDTHGGPTQACNRTHTETQWVPNRDPRKQEMTAEARGCSRERTDTTRRLSKRRREEGREGEDTSTVAGKDSKVLDPTAGKKNSRVGKYLRFKKWLSPVTVRGGGYFDSCNLGYMQGQY